MKLISTALALTLMLSGAVFAADKHDHGHEDKALARGLGHRDQGCGLRIGG
jgi:hypothetical protein